MNREKNQRRQQLRIIISEAIMVVAVILTVIILAFMVSGYWVNSDFEVERQGMLQISSIPTGASLSIDGDSSWLQKTNTSKVLTSGEHTLSLTKDGYDSWSKTINISEGLLYKIHYPRLFLKERTREKVFNANGTTLATVSPDRTTLLLVNETTTWNILDLSEENLTPKKINISKYFADPSLDDEEDASVFAGDILDVNWDKSGSHILFKVDIGDTIEWVLVDINDVKNSINLNKEFGAEFEDIKILDNSSNNLLAVQKGNLHKIDTSGKVVSMVLVENVINFDHFENEVVFSASDESKDYYVGLLKLGDNEVTKLDTTEEPAKVVISKFYENKYITTLEKDLLTLYNKDDFEKVSEFKLNFDPERIKVGHNGEFIIANLGIEIASLDMEANSVREWEVEGESFGWIDNDMVYSVMDGELSVYDFDGLNHRIIGKNVSSRFPVMITDDKWLYYFSDNMIIREWLIKH